MHVFREDENNICITGSCRLICWGKQVPDAAGIPRAPPASAGHQPTPWGSPWLLAALQVRALRLLPAVAHAAATKCPPAQERPPGEGGDGRLAGCVTERLVPARAQSDLWKEGNGATVRASARGGEENSEEKPQFVVGLN